MTSTNPDIRGCVKNIFLSVPDKYSQNNGGAIHLLVKVSGDEVHGELITHLHLMRRTEASCSVTLLLPHVFMAHLLPRIFTSKPVGFQSGVSGPMRPINTLYFVEFYISVTVHLGIILVDNQFETLFTVYLFISFLYMFQATQRSSSGESIVSIHYLVCITL